MKIKVTFKNNKSTFTKRLPETKSEAFVGWIKQQRNVSVSSANANHVKITVNKKDFAKVTKRFLREFAA